MLKKLNTIKLNQPIEATVSSVSNDGKRAIIRFANGIPAATYNVDTTAGKALLNDVKEAYGASKLTDFVGENIYVSLYKKDSYVNTRILTILIEDVEPEINILGESIK